MLYVFHVDTGSMMTLEMRLTLEKVITLKESIFRETRIPIEKQVLLISGGEALTEDKSVSHYHAGTDTNPIYLFSLDVIEADNPNCDIDISMDPELQMMATASREINASMKLPPRHSTVQNRAELTHKIYILSNDQLKSCENLVQYQHLQQQGWSAVLANLEDIIFALQKQYENCEKHFTEYLHYRKNSISVLDKHPEDLSVLSKIPVVPILLENSKSTANGEASAYSEKNQRDIDPIATNSGKLIDLIIPDGQSIQDMGEVAENFKMKLFEITNDTLIYLRIDYNKIKRDSEKKNLRVIDGLTERFSGLQNRRRDCEKIVEELNNFAKSFESNLMRAKSVNDESVYPDLCNSQISTLTDVKHLLTKVKETRIACLKAKNELSKQIISRLKWIVYVERRADEFRSMLLMYSEHVKRLKNELQKYDQIHKCPELYFQAVREIMRRKSFHDNFTQWTFRLSEENKCIWDTEVNIRENFMEKFSSHFLNDYFPGLNDIPPAFATEPPEPFDEALPHINIDFLNDLRSSIPDLAPLLDFNEEVGIPLIIKEGLTPCRPDSPESSFEKDAQSLDMFSSAVSSTIQIKASRYESPPMEPRATSPILILRPTSLRDQPESETDTEEFEKVCCSEGTYSPMETVSNKLSQAKGKLRDIILSADDIRPGSSSPLQEEFETPDLCMDELSRSSPSSELIPESSSILSLNKSNAQTLQSSQQLPPIESFNIKSSQIHLQSTNRSIEGKPFTFDKVLLSTLESNLHDIEQKVLHQRNSEDFDVIFKRTRECMAMIYDKCVIEERKMATSLEDQLTLQNDRLKQELSDAKQEIKLYHGEVYKQKRSLEEAEIEFEESKRTWLFQRDDTIKKITLENEVEKENLKQEFRVDLNIKETVIKNCVQVTDSLEAKLKSLENTNSHAIEKLKAEQNEEINALKHKCDLVANDNLLFKNSLEKSEVYHSEELKKCRDLWEVQKDEEVENKISEKAILLQASHETELEKGRIHHRMEIESLRSRFKLMTMDRSPSETSLEKFERGDFVELSHHEGKLAKLREELLKEKKVALDDLKMALEQSHQLSLQKMKKEQELLMNEKERRMSNEKQELFNAALKDINSDKGRVIENLRLKVETLADENEKLLKATQSSVEIAASKKSSKSKSFGSLLGKASAASGHAIEEYRMKIDILEKELYQLKFFGCACAKQSKFMSSSLTDSTLISQIDTSISNVKRLLIENTDLKKALVRQTADKVKISILTCYQYDYILIVYDETYHHYRVVLDGHSNLHFLHTDSYEELGLSAGSEHQKPEKQYCLAEVVKKEFCQAKKDENRFKVPKGTKFYRVTAKPIDIPTDDSKPKDPDTICSPPSMSDIFSLGNLSSSTLVGDESLEAIAAGSAGNTSGNENKSFSEDNVISKQ